MRLTALLEATGALRSVVFRWTTVSVLLLVALIAALAFVADGTGAPVNLATEAVGIVVGTYLTVGVLDEMRRRQERDVQTGLRTHRLVNELSFNLSRLVRRRGSSAHPMHQMMSVLRAQRPLTTEDVSPDSTVEVTSNQASQFLFALPGRVRADHFGRTAIDEAVASGAFLRTDGSVTEETEIHRALVRIQDDMDRLSATDAPSTVFEAWDTALMVQALRGKTAQLKSISLSSVQLMRAYSHYDIAENLLNEQIALLHRLIDSSWIYVPPRRAPSTPLGAAQEEGIRSEAVTPAEVIHLIREDIAPFGARVARDAFGDTVDDQITHTVDMIHQVLSRMNIDQSNISEEQIRGTAATLLDHEFAQASEGIPVLEHPDVTRRNITRANTVPPAQQSLRQS